VQQRFCHSLLVASLILAVVHTTVGEESVAVRKGEQWRKTTTRTLEDLPEFQPKQVKFNRYGGWASGPKMKATGFFHTRKVDGRWWMVDPEGRLFLSVGVCSVNLSMFPKGRAEEVYGDKDKWTAATAKMLRGQHFNTLSRWSDAADFRQLDQPIAYTTTLSFAKHYAKQRDAKYGQPRFPLECMPVFDPAWPEFCDRYAAKLKDTKDDPWLLGHFTDNEIPFRPYALENYLKLPETDPGRQAAERFLVDLQKQADQITDADKADFLTLVAKRYYETVTAAIRKHDPNHMVIGSRLHGKCINDAVFRGSGSLDVVSMNYYHHWGADHEQLARAATLSGRPILNSEWYANVDQANAGYLVQTQRQRGLFYTHHALSLLEDPNCVGWHWFKYGTHVDQQFQPHADMTDLMRQLNRQVYPLAEYFAR
jgi:hypothetical protein